MPVNTPSSKEVLVDYQIVDQQPLPKAICWYEGMLLSPHHFQQNHHYWSSQLSQMIAKLSPHFWGVSELVIDHNDLLDGTVRIKQLSAILPDGLMINYDINNDPPLDSDASKVGDEPVMVYLTVPIQVEGSASEQSEIQRYDTLDDKKPKKDDNTGDNEQVITRLAPKFSLQISNNVGERYISLPLFRLFKPLEGALQIDPSYSPPLLNIGADKFREGSDATLVGKPLQARAEALAFSIRHKAMQLAGANDSGSDSLGRNLNERHHRYIRAMVQELPALDLAASDASTASLKLYECLVRVAGSISELATSHIPPRFDSYSHIDALPLFVRVMDYISKHISQVNLNYSSLSFDNERPGIFSMMIDKDWESKDLIIELYPTEGISREHMALWLKTCRIATVNLHKNLADRRLLGAKAELIEEGKDSQSGITVNPGNGLFRLKADKRFIQADKKLVIVSTSNKAKAYSPQSIVVHIPHQ